MRLSFLFVVGAAFLLAAVLSLVAASYAVTAVEQNSEIGVRRALDSSGFHWAEVEGDGLRVILTGTAPDEAARFSAISKAGGVVDAARVIDGLDVSPSADLAPPRFSAEILRNDSGISIIGLVPSSTDRDALLFRLQEIADDTRVTDLLETADYPAPDGWEDALSYAAISLRRLPRSKVSVAAGYVKITAISNSGSEKKQLETELTRAAPPGLRLALDIAAPRPVITPFTLRFLIDEDGARFDACSAETEDSRSRILDAAWRAGLADSADCTIGMGVPSPHWSEAARLGITTLARLGGGSITFSNADVTLVAAQGTDPTLFDRAVGELETDLPPVFSLHAVLPQPKEDGNSGPPEFSATRSPEGLVQLRGRLSDEHLRSMVDSFARARFGSDQVYTATRLVPDLPVDWPVRVLAGLEALALLNNGALTVLPDRVELRGASSNEDASAEIARLLSEKLGEAKDYTLDITYRPPPEPKDKAPDPEVCEAQIMDHQKTAKITFEPGSATIAAESLDTMDKIADVLRECGDLRLEIQGHTDSQGREEMNMQLSQSRAQSVLNELRARRVPTSSFVAKGYGESRPISPNDTEEGREDNRRIEFRLLRPAPGPTERETTLETVEQDLDDATDETASVPEAESTDESPAEPATGETE